MNILLFFISYAIGFVPLYIDEQDYVLYLLSIMLYIGITGTFKTIRLKKVVLIPLMLSFTSAIVLSMYFGKGMAYSVLLISTFLYFYFYHQKLEKPKTEETSVEFIKHLILSIVSPIAIFLTLKMLIRDDVVNTCLFIMIYSSVLLVTNLKRKTIFYAFFIIVQLLILVYLSHFTHILSAVEQVILIINVVVFGLMRWVHK